MSQAAKTIFRTRNNAKLQEYMKELVVDCVSGTDTVTVDDAIPAGAYDVKVSARVTTLIVMGGGGATWSLGVTADTDRFAAAKAKTAGTTVTPADVAADQVAGAHARLYAAAIDILLTANAGTWTSGKLRLVISWKAQTAPTQ